MKLLPRLAPLGLFLALTVLGCVGSDNGPKLPPRPTGPLTEGVRVGNLAPDIRGEDADGIAFKLSDYRGKVVLLDFWGHW